MTTQPECIWREESWGDYWSADCDAKGGSHFSFTEGGPVKNKFKHCPYCGKPLVEQPPDHQGAAKPARQHLRGVMSMSEAMRKACEEGRLHEVAPNVELIRAHATRVIRGRVPASVRRELRDAVKAGLLGHLKRDGLMPEIYYHPDHLHGARERQKREAEYAISCISTVIAKPELPDLT